MFQVMTGSSCRRTVCARIIIGALAAGPIAGSALSPVAAQVLVGDGSVACGGAYVMSGGDTLSRVAGRAYGDPMLYGLLVEANASVLADPNNVAVGTSILVPCVDASGRILTPEEASQAAASIEAAVAAEGPLDAAELDALFGPVALFPDQVLTPVLVAVTFPLDVVKAARFVETSADLSDQERAAEAADQPWDDSVRELAAGFPDVVTRMSDNIDWTEQAGEAVVAQTDDVLAAIQRLRARAQENGYLVDNEAQNVEEVDDKIVISSADPGIVYVPTYDSEVVYTTPIAGPPVYHYGYDYYDDGWGDALVAGGIMLGGAVILDEIFDDDDWDGWDDDDDIDWDRGDITVDRGDVDIDVDGDVNIGGGDRVSIGDGDRPQIGNGERAQIGDGRVSIGDSDRTQVDRAALASGDRTAPRDRPGAGALPANRASISSQANRDAARQKIETRKSFGVQPASLSPSRPMAASSREVTRSRPTTRSTAVSRPTANRTPSVRSPSRSNAFQKPSRSRASASSSRGRSSAGRRSGGGGRRR
jgi:Protein of unknown function (DUF3300)